MNHKDILIGGSISSISELAVTLEKIPLFAHFGEFGKLLFGLQTWPYSYHGKDDAELFSCAEKAVLSRPIQSRGKQDGELLVEWSPSMKAPCLIHLPW